MKSVIFSMCKQETNKAAKSSMKNSAGGGKDAAAENSDEVSPVMMELRCHMHHAHTHTLRTDPLKLMHHCANISQHREIQQS